MMDKLGVDFEALRKKHLPEDYMRFHFTSKRKRMATIIENVQNQIHGYNKRLHIKGAAEIILETCSQYIDPYTFTN